MIDDGKLVLRVAKINADSFDTVVEVGGPLSSRKGVNLPDMVIDSPPLTEKDKSDLAFALDAGIEREGKVGLVLFGQRGTVDDHVGKIDALATAQRATHLDHGVETVGIDLRHP